MPIEIHFCYISFRPETTNISKPTLYTCPRASVSVLYIYVRKYSLCLYST